MNPAILLGKLKKYIDQSLSGAGALKGEDGFSPTIEECDDNDDETTYKLKITDESGETTTPNLIGPKGDVGEQGPKGDTGEKGATGEKGEKGDAGTNGRDGAAGKDGAPGAKGETGEAGPQGPKGEKGDDGYPFLIYKEYTNISQFNEEDFPEVGLLFMIKPENETEDNQTASDYPVYRYTGDTGDGTETDENGEKKKYSFVTKLNPKSESIKGDKGDQGEEGPQGPKGDNGITWQPKVGQVSEGETPKVEVKYNDGDKTATFDFTLPKGEKGEDGKAGEQGPQGVPGAKGEDGKTYQPKVVSTTTASNSTQASVTCTTNEESYTADFSFVIPKGEKGEKGEQGEAGAKGENGEKGEDGKTYKPSIGTVEVESEGENGEKKKPSVTVQNDEDKLEAKFSFVLPKGEQGPQGEKGEAGRSIEDMEMTDDNKIHIKYSDSTEEDIGPLNLDIYADFLTESGFGGLRFHENKFQYKDKSESEEEWKDIYPIIPDEDYIKMIPNPMQFIGGFYDHNDKKIKLRWKEPEDTVVDGHCWCFVEKVVIRRNKEKFPENINDGTEVITVNRRDFGKHDSKLFVDDFKEEGEPQINTQYYYKAFSVGSNGLVCDLSENEAIITPKDYSLYGFQINQKESNPDSMITYLPDTDNATFNQAYMDFEKDEFNYGDWQFAFFMNVRPCLLKRDGTVYKYLDINDYTKDENGIDVTNEIQSETDEYNVMIEIPKVYWLIHDNGTDDEQSSDVANIYISDKKLYYDTKQNKVVDKTEESTEYEEFVCWSHIDENGNEIPYCYMPAYNGFVVGTQEDEKVLRSLSGKTLTGSMTGTNEIKYATKNNIEGTHTWYTEVYCDRTLIQLLTLLIIKSTDSRNKIGYGHIQSPLLQTGTMNQKGLFYGNNTTNKTSGMKIFGMENWWGNVYRRTAGHVYYNGHKVKMTWGQSDGSGIDGYNSDGTNYLEIANSTETTGYIKSCIFSPFGIIPHTAGGTATTYYTDDARIANSKSYALYAGSSNSGGDTPFATLGSVDLNNAIDRTYAYVQTSISCKPLATKENYTAIITDDEKIISTDDGDGLIIDGYVAPKEEEEEES